MAPGDRNRAIFNEEACTRCGECFHQCPELRLPLAVAQQEIAHLIAGRSSAHVLAHCTTCMSCNHLCPLDCKPYQLILERWNDLYQDRGAPPIYRFVCPTRDRNIWHMLEALLEPREAAWIRQWMTAQPQGTVLLVGSYVHLLPFVLGDSPLLESLTLVDPLNHWECGAYLYQGGYLDVVREIAAQCQRDLAHWPVDAVVPLHDSVHWMLTHVWPREMNVPAGVPVVNFHQWLLDRLDAGEIELPHPLGLRVTVHDNCYSKTGGGQYWAAPRAILGRAGCEIVEMAHHHEHALCCGFGAGASWVRPHTILFDIMDVARRKLAEAEATGADALVTYCGGCLYLLWAARELFGSDVDIYHLVEVLRLARGECLDYPAAHSRRAWDVIAIITYHLALSLLGRPFPITDLSLADHPWPPRRFWGLKLLRRVLGIPPVQWVFRRAFRVMVGSLKSKRQWAVS